MSQTQTNAISSETQLGDFAAVPKNVEYVETDLPETMIKAVRIIERLLTQTKYHEQHVMYKNYPPVNLTEKQRQAMLEEEEENQGKKPFFPAINQHSMLIIYLTLHRKCQSEGQEVGWREERR